jgi:squalene-associated FAD-dependent desaturase
VLVIGGGLAGCAAALSLARALGPEAVTLLEARGETGGRARSFLDHESGETIDNCQHLLMGCCANLRRFTDALGLRDAWTRQHFLTFATPDGRKSRFAADPLPSPLHLARAFAGLHTLPWRAKTRLGQAVLAMASWKDHGTDQPVESWLAEHRQGEQERKAFWEPVLVSALNDQLDRLGMRATRHLFVEAFLGGKEAFDIWLPARPLGDLFGTEMARGLRNAGVDVQSDCPARSLRLEKNTVTGAVARNDQFYAADHVVLATPHKVSWELISQSGLTPTTNEPEKAGNWSEKMGTSSITAVHLWFNRRFLPVEHAALVGCLGHWVFRKAWAGPHDPYCQVLVSASDPLLDVHANDLVERAAKELIQIFAPGGAGKEIRLMRGRVVREKNATFRQSPGLDLVRPLQKTKYQEISLAGDFTQTGWPATMEGAVRSGLLAAKNALEKMSVPSDRAIPVVESQRSWVQRWLCPIPSP